MTHSHRLWINKLKWGGASTTFSCDFFQKRASNIIVFGHTCLNLGLERYCSQEVSGGLFSSLDLFWKCLVFTRWFAWRFESTDDRELKKTKKFFDNAKDRMLSSLKGSIVDKNPQEFKRQNTLFCRFQIVEIPYIDLIDFLGWQLCKGNNYWHLMCVNNRS